VKIYTRSGDGGETGLFGGGRVPKDHRRVDAYGHVDELNAAIGLARALAPAGPDDGLLQTIQRDLFTVGAELATPDPARVPQALSRGRASLGEVEVAALEHAIDEREPRLAPLKNFILPSGSTPAAAFHLARTVCRRAERAVVALSHAEPVDPVLVRYLNRLSDLLFVLARAANAAAGIPDAKW
jgi:cob(I)alamin adenosyltransferase